MDRDGKKPDDAYGHELWDWFRHRSGLEVIERSDGYIEPSGVAPRNYFAPFKEWHSIEKQAIRSVRGRVLDVGCGAGRVAIYLQNKRGLDVLGIDNSPLALKVSTLRGLRGTRLLAFKDIDFEPRSFDSIVMFGNNFGLFANKGRARRLLKKLFVMTSSEAVIIAESVDPYKTDNPDHLRYQVQNRKRGRMSGQVRIRARHLAHVGDWFDYLLVSPDEMKEIVSGTGWRVGRFILSKGSPLYIGILRKV